MQNLRRLASILPVVRRIPLV